MLKLEEFRVGGGSIHTGVTSTTGSGLNTVRLTIFVLC